MGGRTKELTRQTNGSPGGQSAIPTRVIGQNGKELFAKKDLIGGAREMAAVAEGLDVRDFYYLQVLDSAQRSGLRFSHPPSLFVQGEVPLRRLLWSDAAAGHDLHGVSESQVRRRVLLLAPNPIPAA